MSGTTARLGLYLPGGGSQNLFGPPDPVDVDKLNGNFTLIDFALGIPSVTNTASLPAKPFLWQVIRVLDSDDIVTWNGAKWASFLPARLGASSLSNSYYSKADFGNGALDTRYYTQADLLTGGKLDSRYQPKGVTSAHTQNAHDFKLLALAWTAQTTADGVRGYSKTQRVNFGYTFASVPKVVMSPHTSATAEQHFGVNSVDTTGFTAYYWRSDTVDCLFDIIVLGN